MADDSSDISSGIFLSGNHLLDFGQMIWGEASFDSLKRGIIVQPEKGCIITPHNQDALFRTYSSISKLSSKLIR